MPDGTEVEKISLSGIRAKKAGMAEKYTKEDRAGFPRGGIYP